MNSATGRRSRKEESQGGVARRSRKEEAKTANTDTDKIKSIRTLLQQQESSFCKQKSPSVNSPGKKCKQTDLEEFT